MASSLLSLFIVVFIHVVFAIIGLVGNFAFLFLMFHYKGVRDRKNFIISSMSLSEILVQISSIYASFLYYTDDSPNDFVCRIRYLMLTLNCAAYHVVILAIDRIHYTSNPPQYEMKDGAWVHFGLPAVWLGTYIVLSLTFELFYTNSKCSGILVIITFMWILQLLFVGSIYFATLQIGYQRLKDHSLQADAPSLTCYDKDYSRRMGSKMVDIQQDWTVIKAHVSGAITQGASILPILLVCIFGLTNQNWSPSVTTCLVSGIILSFGYALKPFMYLLQPEMRSCFPAIKRKDNKVNPIFFISSIEEGSTANGNAESCNKIVDQFSEARRSSLPNNIKVELYDK